MIFSTFRLYLRRRALERANETCTALASAISAARLSGDHAAARYFEAEYQLANNKRLALLGDPQPGRYCCDGACNQGRDCVRHSLPQP